MSSFKCPSCDRTFSTRNGLSKHTTKCIITIEEDNELISDRSEIISHNNANTFENAQEDLFVSRENKFKDGFSSKTISFKSIKFHNISQLSETTNNIRNIDLDSDNAKSSRLHNNDNLSVNLDDYSNVSNSFYDQDEDTLQSYNNISDNLSFADSSENISNISNQNEINQTYDEFPNEAYADLMVLVTKYKLSNAAGNAIISFFNKHSNHSKSPLPKNIKQGKIYMNNMNSNLTYKKTKVLDHDNTEYFLYHIPLISCIKNILEIPNITQNFALDFKSLSKTTKVNKH